LTLVAPAGGALVDRVLDSAEAESLRGEAGAMPSIPLSETAVSDVQLIACGAYSPLTGSMGSDDYVHVVRAAQLADGSPWTLPITLPVSRDVAASLAPGTRATLRDPTGDAIGFIDVSEVYRRDLEGEARGVYGTTDTAHPGVRALMQGDELTAAGEVLLMQRAGGDAMTPAATRAEFERRGWSTVVAFQTRNPIHRAHEYLTKVALESADGLLIHPLTGPTKDDDVPVDVRMRCYDVLLDRYYPRERVVLSGFPAAMRYAGPREAIFHGLVRRNYGCSHFIIGRDAAGVGDYYGPYDSQRLYDELGGAARLGFTALKFDHAFFCRACDAMASTRTCPHGAEDHVLLSGTSLRARLANGEDIPDEITRAEVAAILRDAYAIGQRSA
jgi:sulfate adenylyltransferase